MKEYTFKGTKFTMLSNSLKLLNNANKMLVAYRKSLFEFTKDLDLSELNEYNRLINVEKEFIDSYDAEYIENNKEAYENDIKIRKENILRLESEIKNNIGLQSLITLQKDCEESVLYDIVTNIDLMKLTLKGILSGDYSKLDFENPEIFAFIREVIIDFFIFIRQNSLKY